MREYSFDVYVSTHEHMRQGVTALHRTRVSVYAEGYLQASLIALEMGACGGWIPTDLVYVE